MSRHKRLIRLRRIIRRANGAGIAAPVLTFNSESAGLVTLTWDISTSIGTGDTLRRQVRVNGLTDWSVLVDNTDHTITSGENAADQISGDQLTLSNGTYDISGLIVRSGHAGARSNVVTITVSDATPAGAIYWSTADLQWGSGNTMTWG